MNLSNVKHGDHFYLCEGFQTIPFAALHDCKKIQKNGYNYWEVMCINESTGVIIPLSVMVGYEHYLKLTQDEPIPCKIKFRWGDK